MKFWTIKSLDAIPVKGNRVNAQKVERKSVFDLINYMVKWKDKAQVKFILTPAFRDLLKR